MWPRRTPPRQAVLAPDETEDSKLRWVSSHKMDRGPRHKMTLDHSYCNGHEMQNTAAAGPMLGSDSG